jgi:hypothetical protein
MTLTRVESILFTLPHHNAVTFNFASYCKTIADVAASYTVDEILEAIALCKQSIACSNNWEFDDVRARHKTGCKIAALRHALSLKVVGL